MNSKPCKFTVSVIIVSWNARDYLMQCLASVSAEACRYPTEIIVFDNASSDGSADAVAARYPNVRLIRNTENLGFAKANNIAVSASTGRYLCFVNSDVKLLPHSISGLVDFCEAHANVGMAGPRIVGGDGKLQRSCRGFPTVWNMFCRALALDTLFPRNKAFTGYKLYHWPQDSPRPVDILNGCFWLVRREALNQVGPLDEEFFMYAEDMDWCKRFWTQGWQVFFVPSAEANHCGGASTSNSALRFYIEMQKANLKYWVKHHSWSGVASYFVILCLHQSLRATVYYAAALLKRRARQTYQYKARRSLTCLKCLISSIFRPGELRASNRQAPFSRKVRSFELNRS